MSKPLELVIWIRNENHPGASNVIYEHPSGLKAAGDILADSKIRRKRLTEAELASEFHKSTADFQSSHSFYLLFEDEESEQRLDRARDWMFRMELFATHPHYDEAQS